MTPYEYFDLSLNGLANNVPLLNSGFTVFCGCLLVAYAVGSKLTTFQVVSSTSEALGGRRRSLHFVSKKVKAAVATVRTRAVWQMCFRPLCTTKLVFPSFRSTLHREAFA